MDTPLRRTQLFLLVAFIAGCFHLAGLFLASGPPPVKPVPVLRSRIPESLRNSSASGNGQSRYEVTPSSSTCNPDEPVVHMAFIKTHKTGSTTLKQLFDRFGYERNLSYVLKRGHPSSGHYRYKPVKPDIKRKLLPPIGVGNGADPATFRYDMMNIHIRYNQPVMDTIMKPGTRYVTILRDPGHQFESAFVHFGFKRALLPADLRDCPQTVCQMERFLERGDFYRGRLKSYRYKWSKNGQAFDLGLDPTFHADQKAVGAHIEKLAAEFDLVMITEYFHESLLLLRRLMCWDWSDLLFVSRNVRSTTLAVPEPLRQKMRKWNAVDAQLYARFNATLWDKIGEYGPGFRADLAKFRQLLDQTQARCVDSVSKRKASGKRVIYTNKLTPHSTLECQHIVQYLTSSIWRRQTDQQPERQRA